MSQYTVKQFASELKLPVDLLLDQLKNASVKKNNSSDELSEDDKAALLSFLKQSRMVILKNQKIKLHLLVNKIQKSRKQIVQVNLE